MRTPRCRQPSPMGSVGGVTRNRSAVDAMAILAALLVVLATAALASRDVDRVFDLHAGDSPPAAIAETFSLGQKLNVPIR